MRFTAAKSMADSRKAVFTTLVILMTVAACVVGGGGWVARALVHAGVLPDNIKADEAFYIATDFLSSPGMFGLILAALTAALMSTVDTLITAVSAIVVNDIYKPYIRPQASDKQLLKIARFSAVGVSLFGILLVPVFMMFDSIYAAHGAFTAAVTPPLVVTLMFSVFWKRFTNTAALFTLIGGMIAMAVSLFIPEVIQPFSHGVPMKEVDEGIFSGFQQFKFMRACYGIVVCVVIGTVTTFLTKPDSAKQQKGLVWGTIADAIKHYKGSAGSESPSIKAKALPKKIEYDLPLDPQTQFSTVHISQNLADQLKAKPKDFIYISDARSWLGGLNSTHAIISKIDSEIEDSIIHMGPNTYNQVVRPKRVNLPVVVEKLYS